MINMIKHIVMWTIKDQAEGETKQENLNKMRSMLEELPKKISLIKSFEVGMNKYPSDAAADISLISTFASKADLDVYQNHPEHKKVGEFIGKIRIQRFVVDYEI